MTIEQILKLGEMGYSKEEIQQMDAGNHEEKQETQNPEPAPEEPKQEPAAQEPKPEEPAEPDPEILNRMDGLEKKLTDLIKAIQADNIKRDSIGSAGPDVDQVANSALASLITSGIERKEN